MQLSVNGLRSSLIRNIHLVMLALCLQTVEAIISSYVAEKAMLIKDHNLSKAVDCLPQVRSTSMLHLQQVILTMLSLHLMLMDLLTVMFLTSFSMKSC